MAIIGAKQLSAKVCSWHNFTCSGKATSPRVLVNPTRTNKSLIEIGSRRRYEPYIAVQMAEAAIPSSLFVDKIVHPPHKPLGTLASPQPLALVENSRSGHFWSPSIEAMWDL
jgi:hypothetical protein